MNVSLERGGRFRAVGMRPNAHKCAAMRTKIYPYQVRIDATDEKLTPEGYILDNALVQGYFDKRWGKDAGTWEAVSCEVLAITAAKELCGMLMRQGVSVRKVLCRIRGSNGAWIEADCEPKGGN